MIIITGGLLILFEILIPNFEVIKYNKLIYENFNDSNMVIFPPFYNDTLNVEDRTKMLNSKKLFFQQEDFKKYDNKEYISENEHTMNNYYNNESYKLSYNGKDINYYHLIYPSKIYLDYSKALFPPFISNYNGKWPENETNEVIISKDLFDKYNFKENQIIHLDGIYCPQECNQNKTKQFTYKINGYTDDPNYKNTIIGAYSAEDRIVKENNYYLTKDYNTAYLNVKKDFEQYNINLISKDEFIENNPDLIEGIIFNDLSIEEENEIMDTINSKYPYSQIFSKNLNNKVMLNLKIETIVIIIIYIIIATLCIKRNFIREK